MHAVRYMRMAASGIRRLCAQERKKKKEGVHESHRLKFRLHSKFIRRAASATRLPQLIHRLQVVVLYEVKSLNVSDLAIVEDPLMGLRLDVARGSKRAGPRHPRRIFRGDCDGLGEKQARGKRLPRAVGATGLRPAGLG